MQQLAKDTSVAHGGAPGSTAHSCFPDDIPAGKGQSLPPFQTQLSIQQALG